MPSPFRVTTPISQSGTASRRTQLCWMTILRGLEARKEKQNRTAHIRHFPGYQWGPSEGILKKRLEDV